MARATRSAAGHVDKHEDENEKPSSASPPATKAKPVNKKRKRGLGADSDDLPTSKQTKSGDDDGAAISDVGPGLDSEYPPLAGDLPLEDEDAQKILDILDMADTQGLLDRVFPLDDVLHSKPSSLPSSSKTPSDSYSLRTLLKESKEHTLRVFRSAIKQLYPISSQPRSRISPPAAQQLRFCQLAQSLIEQASHHNIDGLKLKPELILPERAAEDEDDADGMDTRRKYALVQRLPTGDLWTSLNSDLLGSDAKPLSDASTGYAELVAVFPSSSSSSTSKPPPTLGDLHTDKKLQTKYKPITTRRVKCGSFLDYGPYASFAPVFDTDGCDVGRMGVSNVLWHRHEKGKAREKARILGDRLRKKLAAQAAEVNAEAEGESMQVDGAVEVEPAEVKAAESRQEAEKPEDLLGKLFDQEESDALQKVLDTLECEENVNELLVRNANALVRLQELQNERLRGGDGISSEVKVDSEEWTLAQTIMDSLTLLASLRPRKPNEEASAIIPPASVLHILHQTLPSAPSQGWHGTLSESRNFAVRDDTTLTVKATVGTQASATTASTTGSAAPTQTPQAAPASNYASNYSYAGFTQQYRPSGTPMVYGSQNQSQGATGYFTGSHTQGATTPLGQKTQTTYQPQYGNSSQFSYGSWYPGQTAAGSTSATPAPSSRKGTPQPITASSSYNSTSYMPYSSVGTAGAATPSRAVANTIATKLQTNGWPTTPTPSNGGYALPPHMRAPAPASGTPASPLSPGTSLGLGSQTYLTGYQATPPTNT